MPAPLACASSCAVPFLVVCVHLEILGSHHLVALVSWHHLGTGRWAVALRNKRARLALWPQLGTGCCLTATHGLGLAVSLDRSRCAACHASLACWHCFAGHRRSLKVFSFPRLPPLLRRTLKASWAPPPQTKPSASTPTAAPAAAATLQQTAARQPSILHVHTCTLTCGCPRQMSRRALGSGVGGPVSARVGLVCPDCKRQRSERAPLNSLPTTLLKLAAPAQLFPSHLLFHHHHLFANHLAPAGAAALCAQLGGLPRGAGPPHGQAARALRVGQAAEQAWRWHACRRLSPGCVLCAGRRLRGRGQGAVPGKAGH